MLEFEFQLVVCCEPVVLFATAEVIEGGKGGLKQRRFMQVVSR
jgi:hypothetical protein